MDCRHHPTCPGCPLAGRAYPEQLATKGARVARAFSRFPHLPAPDAPIGSAWTEAYRHRLKLPVHIGRDRVSIGLYARDGRRVLHTPDCPVLAPGLRDALPPLLDWLRGRRGVHAVDLRVSSATGALQLVLACRDGRLEGGRGAAEALRRAIPALASIAVSVADPEGKRVLGRDARVLLGDATIEEAVGPTRYDLLPGAFFQTDPRQAEALHALVREAVGDARAVLDLYAGVGAYALMLAPGRRRVVAVEEYAPAAAAARRRAPPNVEVVAGRAEDGVEGRFDVAVLNPARRGADPKTLAQLARAAERVVYVSCGPETLARDLDALAAHGLRVVRARPIDLFPQTPEIETVVTLARGAPVRRWAVPGGQAQGPWGGGPSGAIGRPTEVIALLVGEVSDGTHLPGARVERLGTVAGHSLVRLRTDGDATGALRTLARRGRPVAGEDRRTARFFDEKAGLQRPFVHVAAAGKARAPLHGDLVLALEALGAERGVLARVGVPPA